MSSTDELAGRQVTQEMGKARVGPLLRLLQNSGKTRIQFSNLKRNSADLTQMAEFVMRTPVPDTFGLPLKFRGLYFA